ncbi:hypothetical protein NYE69_05480 [Paenibacillus sp. FSL R5-0527]|uniref:hypothetical protein n=1 Tax=Paenibacillus sp. FSL R5-0527 TaxID=2975321 RepID=UPI00097B5724|nr:hypothetical protein BK140_08810 [Paenibacillus macerans]
MAKLLKIWLFTISLSLLSGCYVSHQGNVNGSEKAKNYPNESKGTEENSESEYIVFTKVQDLEPPTLSDFKEGVNVDLSQYEKSFFTDEIIGMVGKNLEAIVNHDETQFNNIDNYQPGVEYDFHEVTLIEKIKDIGRINVAIAFLRKKHDDTIERGTAHYSFLQNINGDWEITLIDAN